MRGQKIKYKSNPLFEQRVFDLKLFFFSQLVGVFLFYENGAPSSKKERNNFKEIPIGLEEVEEEK